MPTPSNTQTEAGPHAWTRIKLTRSSKLRTSSTPRAGGRSGALDVRTQHPQRRPWAHPTWSCRVEAWAPAGHTQGSTGEGRAHILKCARARVRRARLQARAGQRSTLCDTWGCSQPHRWPRRPGPAGGSSSGACWGVLLGRRTPALWGRRHARSTAVSRRVRTRTGLGSTRLVLGAAQRCARAGRAFPQRRERPCRGNLCRQVCADPRLRVPAPLNESQSQTSVKRTASATIQPCQARLGGPSPGRHLPAQA